MSDINGSEARFEAGCQAAAAANDHRSVFFQISYYEALGVDTDEALKQVSTIPISIHRWQGDDVGGFEGTG